MLISYNAHYVKWADQKRPETFKRSSFTRTKAIKTPGEIFPNFSNLLNY